MEQNLALALVPPPKNDEDYTRVVLRASDLCLWKNERRHPLLPYQKLFISLLRDMPDVRSLYAVSMLALAEQTR